MENLANKEIRRFKGSNNSAVLLIAGALVVVIILVALIAFLILKGPGSKGAAELSSFYPQETLFYAELNITPEKFKQLEKVSGGALSLENLAKAIQEAAKNPDQAVKAAQLVNEMNKTFEPKLAIGFWGTETTNGNPEKVLLSAVVKDTTNIKQFLEQASTEGVTYTPKTIEDQEFYVSSNAQGGGYVVVKDVLLLSDKIETLQEAINYNKDGKTNVLNNPDVKDVLSNLQPTRIFTMLINTAAVNKLQSPMSAGANSEAIQQFLGTMTYSGFGVDIHEEVIEGKFYSPYSLESIKDPNLKTTLEKVFNASSKLDAPKVLPDDAFAYISLSGVSHIIMTATQFMEPQGKMEYENSKKMVKMFTTLDLETELLPIFSEELTVGARINAGQFEPMVVVTEKPETAQILNKLASAASTFDPSASVTEVDVSGKKINVVSTRAVPFKVGFAGLNNVMVLGKADTLQSVVEALNDPSKSLANSETYKNLSKYIPEKVSFAMYLNYDKLPEAAQAMGQPPQKVAELQEMSKNIQAIVISAGNKDSKAIEGTLLVKLRAK